MRTMDDDFDDDDFDDGEVIENAVLCPTCEDVTGHQILREKEICLLYTSPSPRD